MGKSADQAGNNRKTDTGSHPSDSAGVFVLHVKVRPVQPLLTIGRQVKDAILDPVVLPTGYNIRMLLRIHFTQIVQLVRLLIQVELLPIGRTKWFWHPENFPLVRKTGLLTRQCVSNNVNGWPDLCFAPQ